MRILGSLAVAAACGMLFSGYVKADDDAATLADLKAKVAALESRTMAPASAGAGAGDASALTGLRSDKARIQFGGDFEVYTQVIHRTTKNNESDKFDYTQFNTNNANLLMKVTTLSPDTYLTVKLDLDDFWGDTKTQSAGNNSDTATKGQGDDLLEEVYYTWKNIRGSAFDFQFGKKEAPFGQDVRTLITDGYTHNDKTGTYLGRAYETTGAASTAANDHGQVGYTPFSHPGEIDNVYSFQTNWHYKELLNLEFAVFQNRDADNVSNRRGMHEDSSEDSLLFRSYATRATFKPISDLSIEASFANQHLDYMDDNSEFTTPFTVGGKAYQWFKPGDGDADQQSLSLGVDYNPKKGPVRLYFEYIHGFNWEYSDQISADVIQTGVAWHVIENKLDLCFDFNWLGLQNDRLDRSNSGGGTEDYYRIGVGPKYTTESGIWFALEYGHEWYRNNVDAWDDADADIVSFMTGWQF